VSLDSFHVVPPVSHSRPSRIALLGFGTVGAAVARRLTGPEAVRGLQLTHIVDRRADHKRARFAPEGVVWASTLDEILEGDIDIVVEAIGGLEPATDWIRRALTAGKSVVTANKQVIARDGIALWTLAARHGRQLRFEAAVGGAMPIVRAISDGLAGDRITRIVGILNGTTNAVLSRMEAVGCSLDQALADARSRGYAEADPSGDLDGDDARAKLAILCALAFGLRVDPLRITAQSRVQTSIGPAAAAARSVSSPTPNTTSPRPRSMLGWRRSPCREDRCSRARPARRTPRSSPAFTPVILASSAQARGAMPRRSRSSVISRPSPKTGRR